MKTYTYTRDNETVTLWRDDSARKPLFVQIGDSGPQSFATDTERAEYINWRFEMAEWAARTETQPMTVDGATLKLHRTPVATINAQVEFARKALHGDDNAA